jgi:hypothetical protein
MVVLKITGSLLGVRILRHASAGYKSDPVVTDKHAPLSGGQDKE